METAQIRAEIERISYRNEDNGWTVLKARNCADDSSVTATGHFAAVHPGETFELFGTWGHHKTYGTQFKIERIVPIRPSSAPAIERYLASGLIKGIGPKTAERIVAHFGDDTLAILDADPKALFGVKALGAKKASAIIESWEEQRAIAGVMMFLNTHGISPTFAIKIYKQYGNDSIAIVSADPYRLANDIHGIGFLKADQIARSMGIAPDSIERTRAAILYVMQQAEEKGHCYVTSDQILKELVQVLRVEEDRIVPRLADGLGMLGDVGAIITERITTDAGDTVAAHFRAELLAAELDVAGVTQSFLANDLKVDESRLDAWLDRYAEASGTPLSEEQLEAVRKACSARIFILTGGPGVGKTTTANAIIRLLKAMGRSVALGAPTGRAAQRLTEVAAAPAKTLHRLLEWVPRMGTFARDANNPLPAGAVIVDEASMLDIRLASALFRAVDPRSQLILIGDVDQLPSVGPGNVLRDLIDSGRVPYTRLSKIFRQANASRIVRAAHALNAGEMPELDESDANDCLFLEAETAEDIKTLTKRLIREILPRKGFNPLSDIQILTPMNRGELGTQTLNEELQALLNPARPGVDPYVRGSLTLRPGDKVIQSSNNYDLGVFNGDIGFVRQTRVEGGKLMVAFGEDRVIAYDPDQAGDLRLAYSITIHKSQGSEFPAVIIPCSMQHFVMMQRNLMYTALTRARKLAIFVGSKKALQFAAGNQTSGQRQTTLVEKIRNASS